MDSLIRVVQGEVVMDSRAIAEHFGKTHHNVMLDINDEISKLEKVGISGEQVFQASYYVNNCNKKLACYSMGKEGAMQIAARYDAVARYMLIKKIKELECFNIDAMPKTKLDYMRLAVSLTEENQLLEAKAHANAPMVKMAKAMETSQGSVLIRDFSKIIQKSGIEFGEKKLYEWMRQNEYVQMTANMPTQKAVDLGVLEAVERLVFIKDGESRPKFTTKVTGKGQIYFIKKLSGFAGKPEIDWDEC